MKILIVGHSRCGKDTAGEYLESISNLKFAGTTSKFLAKYVAEYLGRPVDEVYASRHANRELWFKIGNELRAKNPGVLIRESLKFGDIVGGIRDIEEIILTRQQELVDLVVWIENNRVPEDPTLTFTSEHADVVIQNNWGLPEFEARLHKLAKATGILAAA